MSKKILLVEDERDLVTAVAYRLNKQGYDVVTAFDGDEGFAKAKSEKPDLIILDILLKAESGYLVLDMLGMTAETSLIPIITMSGFTQEEIQKRTHYNKAETGQVNVVFFAPKPLDMEIFIERVGEFFKASSVR